MRIIALILFLAVALRLPAQTVEKMLNIDAVREVETALASDAMRGRATYSPDIERAADYIESEFRKAGLRTWNRSKSYRQPFFMIHARLVSLTGNIDGNALSADNSLVISSAPHLQITDQSGYVKGFVKAGDNLGTAAIHFIGENKNYLVLVDTSFTKNFRRLTRLAGSQFKSNRNIVFVLTVSPANHFSITADQEINDSKPLANVVGILPGKSKKKEYVIFSGHYDHMGVGQPINGDSIYNGANDDASGTTAVILLARYFSQHKQNQRTLVFAAFTAEEIGEYGSQYFSSQFQPNAVMAMFNIEMIGTPSKWGTNSAFITGYERTDMGKILEKNLAGSEFTFYPDPYPEQNLFYRSDNASLAKQGVPAHTISTTQIDIDKTYHQPGDEISTLDMNNMVNIIKAIAISSKTIVAGTDTPTRVDATQLR